MSDKAIAFTQLAGYVENETARWREYLMGAPSNVLDIALGNGADGTVRTLIKHIFAVELRYAQRLAGEEVSAYEDMPDATIDELWQIHARANAVRGRYLESASDEDMDRILVSDTRKLGRIESRAHTVLVHSLVHGIRHWAQIATVLRLHGYGALWEHDWLLNPAVQ